MDRKLLELVLGKLKLMSHLTVTAVNPIIIPKRKGIAEGIENVIISLCVKGMSNTDIEEKMREIYDFKVSPSTISRIKDRLSDDIIA